MKKYRSHLFLSALLLFNGCQDKKDPSMTDLEKIGYKQIYCDSIDYYDSKADIAEDPFYKIYTRLEVNNPNLSILAARCFRENHCIYELINNNEVVCQKYVVASRGDFFKTWDDHKVLVFNTKNYVN